MISHVIYENTFETKFRIFTSLSFQHRIWWSFNERSKLLKQISDKIIEVITIIYEGFCDFNWNYILFNIFWIIFRLEQHNLFNRISIK